MATPAQAFPVTDSSPGLISCTKRPGLLNTGSVLLLVSLLISTLQLCWFGFRCAHQIDADGIDYTGIALELKQGHFHESVNAFRSPLISWLMAAIPGLHPFQSGKLITIVSYMASIILVYFFTRRLWHSDTAAGFAALLVAVARGVAFDAIALISPDFLLTDLVLIYFLILLDCIRKDRRWFWLGCIHGLAYLAKAIALPWLAVATLTAAVSFGNTTEKLKRVATAALIPILIATLWASVLHSKYGVFTTGSQFKTNLLQWTLREYRNHRPQTYSVLEDISWSTDEHMVVDPMPPGSWTWRYKLDIRQLFPKIVEAEKTNLPRMLKSLIILANPGLLLGLLLLVGSRTRTTVLLSRQSRILLFVVFVTATSLAFAYCMLVVDERYLLPLFPLLVAFGSRFMVGRGDLAPQSLRAFCWMLAVGALLWSLVYPSSPFRVQTRDFQVACYQAGAALRRSPGTDVVSIGSGPYQEHGVGWEAGYKAAFFGEKRLIATDESWARNQLAPLLNDLQKAHASSILVWSGDNEARKELLNSLQSHYVVESRITDPTLGDVGVVLVSRNLNIAGNR